MSGRGAIVALVSRDHREQLADLLREARCRGSFATRRTAPAGELAIEVRGVGPVELPVSAAQAKELRLVARPARYGQGEDTVLDRRVRDTWEIPRSRVKIDWRRWNQTLAPMLDTVRDDLGFPVAARLRADLHSMLVYEPGQFFAAHQDSEKTDDMIGSLVVMLPSKCTGGDLVIEHRGQSVRYRGSASSLAFVAFYSDTRHEVLPVERGYRIVLTYNLTLAGHAAASQGGDPELTAAIAALLEQHFAHAPEPRWRGDGLALEPPDRLVMLLDHQYTERGLHWSHLKGDDAARADVIGRAADLADCDVALAHAEVEETWECYDDTPPWSGRRRYCDDEPDTTNDDVELGELLDSSVRITSTVDGAVAFAADVSPAELAEVTPSVELTPHDTEYTGYMGNWGNTMDRWYRRAAIVIWPRARTFALQAKADPVAAIHQTIDAIDNDQDQASDMVTTLLRFWPDSVRSSDQRTLLPLALNLARRLADRGHTTGVLEPFALEALTPADATLALALTEQHGLGWLDQQIATWSRERHRHAGSALPDRAAWVASLPDLVTNLRGDPDADETLRTGAARILVNHAWEWLDNALDQAACVPTPSRRDTLLASLSTPLLAVLHAAAIANAADLRDAVLATITPRSRDLATALAGTVTAAAHLPAPDLTHTGMASIAQALIETLEQDLARPERATHDWSIITFTNPDCCQDCTRLASFLHDADQQQLSWPLAKPRRQHIHRRIDEAELPVTHHTLRQGSPHKLILSKTDDLFHRDATQRRVARTWLETTQQLLNTAT